MYLSNRALFYKSRKLISLEGDDVPVLDMDVFSVHERIVEYDIKDLGELTIKWSKCLTYDSKGKISEAERIEVFVFSDETNTNYTEDYVIECFNTILTHRGGIETFRYIQCTWIVALKTIFDDMKLVGEGLQKDGEPEPEEKDIGSK